MPDERKDLTTKLRQTLAEPDGKKRLTTALSQHFSPSNGLNRKQRRALEKLARSPVAAEKVLGGLLAEKGTELEVQRGNIIESPAFQEAEALRETAEQRGMWSRETILSEVDDSVRQQIRDLLIGQTRTPAFRSRLSELVSEASVEVAKEILAEGMPKLEEEVRALVKSRWQSDVEATAHALLQQKLDEIRRKL